MSKPEVSEEARVGQMINDLVRKAEVAAQEYLKLDQEQVDEIIKQMSMAGLDNHMLLSKMAVEETGRGIVEDKVIKNIYATEYIYNNIKDQKSVGVINEDEQAGYEEIAEPVGIIAGVTPVTNPTSTTMFKALIAAKTRNVIIFGFHPSAQKCGVESARLLRDAAVKAGAPENCILWIKNPSVLATNLLMNHPGVDLILATGGTNMVKAAYACGKPALGVGPGNVPCYIEKSANLKRAINDIIMSKTFDNGMICASEQAVIVDSTIARDFEKLMIENNCHFLYDQDAKKLEKIMFKAEKDNALNPDIVGMNAYNIAKLAKIDVPEETKILVVRQSNVGEKHPFSKEKLSPVLAYYVVNDANEGIKRAEEVISLGGLGHTGVIHSNNQDIINKFAQTIKAGRILVNSPASQGAIGDIYNANIPSLTLGCGSYGSNSTTANVSSVNLVNIKKVAKRKNNMQWFKIPPKIYFEEGSISYLEKMKDISRVFIVTDEVMVKLGYVDKLMYWLRKRKEPVVVEVFHNVEADPCFDTVYKGVEAMNRFEPDAIIALGGGSPIDAAKGMWLFYEYPDVDVTGLKLKFLDIRKRTYDYPNLGSKAKLIAIPTTSGTGSEVTAFAVITDKVNNIKYPLADYALTPDVAIIDPQLVKTMPKEITADTGLDVLTHAIEAYVSVLASDYTDALAEKAIQLVFDYLPIAYKDGDNELAREKMHNAACIAGMAFTNAFLGINHSLAHKIGGEYHIPHGRANAILLPHVIAYNASIPTKFTSFPKYENFIADEKYAKLAKMLGLKADNKKQGIASLIMAINDLLNQLDVPNSFRKCDINEKEFNEKLDMIASRAFEDQCTTANPRMPLINELKEILIRAYK